MDYNTQAVHYGAWGANHPEAVTPYFDFIAEQLAGGGPQVCTY